ncbi:MAG: hypothetical protein B7X28_00845 [Halothiobacillus sp. 13-55-253]|jgi:hypothetical protein|nr:MAG: hypothetical protein B7X28_00845 [Halothiobacillus sp. 13-55-253]
MRGLAFSTEHHNFNKRTSPPFSKGGQGGFDEACIWLSESPSIPLFQRGKFCAAILFKVGGCARVGFFNGEGYVRGSA